MRMELDYRNGQTKPTDIGKLSSDTPFEGSVKIGRSEMYEKVDTFANLAGICNRLGVRPVMLAVKEIGLSFSP